MNAFILPFGRKYMHVPGGPGAWESKNQNYRRLDTHPRRFALKLIHQQSNFIALLRFFLSGASCTSSHSTTYNAGSKCSRTNAPHLSLYPSMQTATGKSASSTETEIF